MRVVDIRREDAGGRAGLRGTVVWEQSARPPEPVWIETPQEHAQGFGVRGETFVLATLVPAMERGERRLAVEAPLCPTFRRGVRSAQRALRGQQGRLASTEIEPLASEEAPRPAPTPTAATTFSGGVDSLATIAANRAELPRDHPSSLRVGFFVCGMNTHDVVGGRVDAARRLDFDRRLARWGPVAAAAGIQLVPVSMNFRSLAVSFPSWARHSIGAALAAVAHAFSGRVTRFVVPSTGSSNPNRMDSCRPELDPFYGNAALTIADDGVLADRLDKLTLLTRWPEGLAMAQPCQQHELLDREGNCGECNKCHRTLVALEALDLRRRATSFPSGTIDATWVTRMRLASGLDAETLEAAAAALRARGRADLADAAAARLRRFRRSERVRAWKRALPWRRRRPEGA